jgi:calcium permeable stress-gated cation channel
MINNSYHPLISALPLSLVDRMLEAQVNEKENDAVRRSETNNSDTRLRPAHGGSDDLEMEDRRRMEENNQMADRMEKSEQEKAGKKKLRHETESSEEEGGLKAADFFYSEPMAARQKKEDEYGFAHPAASRPQRIVWLPLASGTTASLSKSEARECVESGVNVSLVDAEMNEKGKVDIHGSPPDLVRED